MQPILTIFCAFTRPWAVDMWLDNLANVEHDPERTNLCFIIDSDEMIILRKLTDFGKGYRSLHTIINRDWSPNEVRIAIRRQRIAEVKNQSKQLIGKCDGDIVIGFEDDTVFDRLKSFEPLYAPLEDNTIGFVEGVQIGRWGANMVGAWRADQLPNPLKVWTLLPTEGYEVITGGGFYGYATLKDLYMRHHYHTKQGEPWGPDVNYGFWLHEKGYDSLINWDVIFGHRDHNTIGYPDQLPPNQKLAEVTFTRRNPFTEWQRQDEDKGRY